MTVFAIDYSVSQGAINYWKMVSKLVSETTEDARCIFWDSRNPIVINEQEVQEKTKSLNKQERYDRDPSTFISEIAKLTSDIYLTIITDGQIDNEAINRHDALMEKHAIKLKQTTIHFINTGGKINLSIAAPFIRETKYQIMVDGELYEKGTTHLIDLEQYLYQPLKFIQDGPYIIKQLEMQNLGRNNHQMHDKLLDLQEKLLKEISVDSSSDILKIKNLRDALSKERYTWALEIMKDCFYSIKKMETLFQTMLQKCDGRSSLSLNRLQSNSITSAAKITTVTPDILEEISSSPTKEYLQFECPITYDCNPLVLLVKEGLPILEGLSKDYQDRLISNPLCILDHPDLVKALQDRLDHPIGQKTAQALFEQKKNASYIESPNTGDKITCFLSTLNRHSHKEATNYSLANLFFGTKLVGIPELWLAVVYLAAKQKKHLTWEDSSTFNTLKRTAFIETFKDSLISRMKNTFTKCTLSGLPIKPFIKCPIDIALWYCVISPWLYNDTESNRLRSIVTRHHLSLLDILGYPYEKEWTSRQLVRYQVFGQMMNEENKNALNFRKLLRSTYQHSMTLQDGTIILLDGPCINPDESFMSVVSIEEALSLANLVDPTKKPDDVIIPNYLEILPIPVPKTNYSYSYNEDFFSKELEISPLTMRPYISDHTSKEQLFAYNYFIKFINEQDKYPTKDEFLKWMADKQENDAIDTLPKEVAFMVHNLSLAYSKVGIYLDDPDSNTISVKRFKKLSSKSQSEVSCCYL